MKKLHVDAKEKTQLVRATQGSCGYDIYATRSFLLWPFKTKRVKTNLTLRLSSSNEFGMLTATSSMAMRGIDIPNGSGIIDFDYFFTGKPFSVVMRNATLLPIRIRIGQKVAQLIVLQSHCLAQGTTLKIDRVGGFGSTNETKPS